MTLSVVHVKNVICEYMNITAPYFISDLACAMICYGRGAQNVEGSSIFTYQICDMRDCLEV